MSRTLRIVMIRNTDPLSWPLASKARLAAWRRLKTKKGRRQTGQIIVEGIRLVGEALISDCPIEALIAVDSPEGRVSARRVLARMGDWTGSRVRVPPSEFKRLADTLHSTGVGAVVSWRPDRWESLPSFRPRHLLFCDKLSDPGNLGALIRTAAGLGLHAVLVGPDSVDLSNPKTVRATAGALFRIPVIGSAPIEDFIAWCRKRGYVVYVADRNRGHPGKATPPGAVRGWALVIGGETSGPSAAWDTAGVHWLSIPMRRGVESFNAAVAGAILMDRLSVRAK